ncbi:hypothetical protein CHS0354_006531, partial [Potamilus streckersoni]
CRKGVIFNFQRKETWRTIPAVKELHSSRKLWTQSSEQNRLAVVASDQKHHRAEPGTSTVAHYQFCRFYQGLRQRTSGVALEHSEVVRHPGTIR